MTVTLAGSGWFHAWGGGMPRLWWRHGSQGEGDRVMAMLRNGLIVLLLAAPVLAQVPPAEIGQRNVPAPWWMQQPVIASIGMVRSELPANRATFEARFSAIGKTAEAATAVAAAKVAELDKRLRALGAERVRIVTYFATRPLYEQYRDKDGNLQTNSRPDKIDRYAVEARISLDVRDMAALEASYAMVLDAGPDSIGQVNFRLESGNAVNSWLQAEAVKDAARRAREAAGHAGSRLGAAKLIDPTARACQTDVLAGWPSYGASPRATDVEAPAPLRMTASALPAPPPPPAPPASGDAMVTPRVSLQPPLLPVSDSACVVYALLP
ncbi:MAG: hypothetical protein RL490_1299 [Pseudomonadota bacterium]|jgi:uncharacterized protein YggE